MLIFVLVFFHLKEYFLGVLGNLRGALLLDHLKDAELLHHCKWRQEFFSKRRFNFRNCSSSPFSEFNDANYNHSDSLNRRLYV
jgi:hypothetical protein